MPRRRRAFTLVELLVVVAVLAVLAAILFPVLAQAREKGRQAACLANERQIGMALLLYAGDYDETLPGNDGENAGLGLPLGWMAPGAPRNWAAALQPYLRSLAVFRCPSAAASDLRYPGWEASLLTGAGATAYLWNGCAADRALAVIPEPAALIALQESVYLTAAAQVRPTLPWWAPGFAFHLNHDSYNATHFGGGNLLFCDGHAAWRAKTAVRYQELGVLGGTCPAGRTTSAPPVSDEAHAETCPLAF